MRCLLIYNSYSGKGRFIEEIPVIKSLVEQKGHFLNILEIFDGEDALTKLSDIMQNFDCLLIAGGDGTLNSVINAVMLLKIESRPKILLIPRGTCNDVARCFGIKKDLKQNIDLLDTEPVKTDIGQINQQYFCYAVACGAFSEVTYGANRKDVKRFGYLAYIKEGIKKVGKNKKIPMKITHDLGEIYGDFCLGILLNSKKVAGFSLRFYSEAKMNDGFLEMRALRSTGFLNMLKIIFFFVLLGRLQKRDEHIISKNFWVDVPADIYWNIDGERGPAGRVFIKAHQEAVAFFMTKRSKKSNYQ